MHNSNNVTENKQHPGCKTCDVFYSWSSALTSYPAGWHSPTDKELDQLAQYISCHKGHYYSSFEIGNAVEKHLNATHVWPEYNKDTDDSALPGSSRDYNYEFLKIEVCVNRWSSTEYSQSSVWAGMAPCRFGRKQIQNPLLHLHKLLCTILKKYPMQ